MRRPAGGRTVGAAVARLGSAVDVETHQAAARRRARRRSDRAIGAVSQPLSRAGSGLPPSQLRAACPPPSRPARCNDERRLSASRALALRSCLEATALPRMAALRIALSLIHTESAAGTDVNACVASEEGREAPGDAGTLYTA